MKSAVLVLVWWCKAISDREQDLWRYWLSEGYIKQRYDKPTADGCLCKKCDLQQQWSSDIAVSRTLTKHCNIRSENTIFERLWLSPLTRMSIDIADRSCFLYCLLGLRAFCQAVLLVTYVVATKNWSCLELDPHLEILGWFWKHFRSIFRFYCWK